MTTHTEAELRGDLERLRWAVAEAAGWEPQPNPMVWRAPKGGMRPASWIPKYEVSLDACRTFEAGLCKADAETFDYEITDIAYDQKQHVWQLSPVDHCIAFLRLRNVITQTVLQ